MTTTQASNHHPLLTKGTTVSQYKVTTATTGDSTHVTVDGLLQISITGGRVTIELDNKDIHVDRDVPANMLTILPYHPRLAYVAPELHDEVRAELGL